MLHDVCAHCGLYTPTKAIQTGHATMCACLDEGSPHQRIWAVDPGDKHVGVTALLIDDYEIVPLQSWTLEPDTWYQALTRIIVKQWVDVLVCEEYRLYPWMARQQGYSDFPTAQAIGVTNYLCKQAGIPVVMQGASIKELSIAVCRGKGIPLRKLPSGKEELPGRNQHERDSMAHGYWYAYRNPSSPIVLAEETARSAGNPRKQ